MRNRRPTDQEVDLTGLVSEHQVLRQVVLQGGMWYWSCALTTSTLMQAFAEFTDAGSCASAKAAIHGRMFAGETIRAQYVTPQYFAQLPQ